MPYEVVDKKTQIDGPHWVSYSTDLDFGLELIPGYTKNPSELIAELDSLNPGVLTEEDKISIVSTLELSAKQFNVDEQSFTRTRLFNSKEIYDKFTLFLSQVDLESIYPSFYPLKYTSEILSEQEI